MLKALTLSLLLLTAPLTAASPFAANLKGLKYLVLDINGDAAAAKKAGVPFKDLLTQLKAQMGKAGIKVVSGGKDVPEGKQALPGELIIGMTTHSGFTSYALTLQVYEPMHIDGKDRLYVAWTNMTYGFAPKDKLKKLIKEQVASLVSSFLKDKKAAR